MAVQRFGGADRFATAASVSAAHFAPGVAAAFVATGADFPDALAGGPAAARAGGPILLVSRREIPPATTTELVRLRPSRIVVLGGAGVISDAVVAALAGYQTGGGVQRIGGADRYATAALVSRQTFAPGLGAAYVATGLAFPDALVGGAAAARAGSPVLLTRPGTLPSATVTELRRLAPARIVVLGGPSAVGEGVVAQLRSLATTGAVIRLAGPDRYATAAAISRASFPAGVPGLYVATGIGFPDALVAVPAAARIGAALLLVPGSASRAVGHPKRGRAPAAGAARAARRHGGHERTGDVRPARGGRRPRSAARVLLPGCAHPVSRVRRLAAHAARHRS